MFEGTFIHGQVVFDEPPPLAEGVRVRVEALPAPEAPETPGGSMAGLLEFAGKVKDWPSDMARNHDHYIHGARRK